jgi:Domain of unknown function (DUF5594)
MMDPAVAHRFDTEFAPRIAHALADFFGARAQVDVIPHASADRPTAITVRAPAREYLPGYLHPLDIRITWDPDEIERLMGPHGAERFANYLGALPRKLAAWEAARDVDFRSRSQADPSVLLGNLDFSA